MTVINTKNFALFPIANASLSRTIPADWRDLLFIRLGQRPRRIGEWAELALYGALQCLDDHNLSVLSPHTILRVASTYGPTVAIANTWASSSHKTLPMPFDFLQSQPSQMLAALSKHLQWQGDASFMAHENLDDLCTHINTEADSLRHQAQQLKRPWGGLLLGYVDLVPAPRSQWCLIK